MVPDSEDEILRLAAASVELEKLEEAEAGRQSHQLMEDSFVSLVNS